MSEKYAKKVYTHILNNNYFEFKPNLFSYCYVSGAQQWDWTDDYFVIPYADYELKEWEKIVDELYDKFHREDKKING